MIKLKLKRRISGKAIKKSRKFLERHNAVTYTDYNGVAQIKYYPKHIRYRYDKNKPTGKKYPKALYELKSINQWQAEKLAKEFKKKGQTGKLKRLYKLQPEIDPKVIREKEHQDAIRKWQAKLKKNELIQHQNNRP